MRDGYAHLCLWTGGSGVPGSCDLNHGQVQRPLLRVERRRPREIASVKPAARNLDDAQQQRRWTYSALKYF